MVLVNKKNIETSELWSIAEEGGATVALDKKRKKSVDRKKIMYNTW